MSPARRSPAAVSISACKRIARAPAPITSSSRATQAMSSGARTFGITSDITAPAAGPSANATMSRWHHGVSRPLMRTATVRPPSRPPARALTTSARASSLADTATASSRSITTSSADRPLALANIRRRGAGNRQTRATRTHAARQPTASGRAQERPRPSSKTTGADVDSQHRAQHASSAAAGCAARKRIAASGLSGPPAGRRIWCPPPARAPV